MPSMISFVIHSSTTGRRDENRRETSPNTTTAGPDSHTILSTAGTLRSAEMRSCHPVQKLSRSAMLQSYLFRWFTVARQTKSQEYLKTERRPLFLFSCTKDAQTVSKGLSDNLWPVRKPGGRPFDALALTLHRDGHDLMIAQ